MSKSSFIKSTTILIGASLLAACTGNQVASPGANDQVARNSVQLVRFAHTVKAEDDGTDTLSGKTLTELNVFLANTNVGYGDVVMIDSAKSASEDRVTEIADMIRSRGFTYAGRTLLGGKPESGDLILYVERYTVTTPNCGLWPNEPDSSRKNNVSSFNGCANTSNLGLMVANPRDLITGQAGRNTTGAAVGAILGSPAPAAPTTTTNTLTISAPNGESGTPSITIGTTQTGSGSNNN
jgi:pilus biogenesis lipoprotein CpaD